MKKINKQQNKKAVKKVQESIDTKIAKAVSAEKRISERIFGYVPYNISFIKATYTGKTQRPAKITAIEKGIIGILLIDETSSFVRIGSILGLDVVHDKAEEAILRSAINILLSFNAIEGDDSCLALTEGGRAYADKGERPDTYSKAFDIYVDVQHPYWFNIKNCLGDRYNELNVINTPCEDLNLTLDQIKSYAEHQAQDVHFPENRYLLESAVWNFGHQASYKVFVCFVQNVATAEVRAFVYDDKQNALNELIAAQINADESLKNEILANCIKIECENDDTTEILEGDAVETAKAEISAEIKEAEQLMVQEEAEQNKNDISTEKGINLETGNNVEQLTTQKTQEKERLHKKALYDSLSFEIELQKIFQEDDPDEIWMISPWIKGIEKNNGHSVFVDQRGPAIETFLQDENKRVFVAYSAPSVTKSGKPRTDENGNIIENIDDDVRKLIKNFEEQYPNFFIVELPEFHVKNVIEVKSDQRILFTGSFNVLSFSVSEGQTHIRREEMTLAHHSVARKKYCDYQYEFALAYSERIKKEIESMDDSKVLNYKNERLEYFLGIQNQEIQQIFLPIEELLEEKSLAYTKRDLEHKLALVGQELVAASNMNGISPKDKKRIESTLLNIENEMKSNSIDDPSMLDLLNNDRELLDTVHEKKIFPERKDYSQRNNKTFSSEHAANRKDASVVDLNSLPEATIESLSLYIASLSLAFVRQDIRKFALNSKLVELVKHSEMVDLLEVLNVTPNKQDDTAFDLSLGLNGYIFWFPKLYDHKEEFEVLIKKTYKRLISVSPKNIESTVKKLS